MGLRITACLIWGEWAERKTNQGIFLQLNEGFVTFINLRKIFSFPLISLNPNTLLKFNPQPTLYIWETEGQYL